MSKAVYTNKIINYDTIRKLTEFQLLNAYTLERAGFIGKAGSSLLFFELSKFDKQLADSLFLEDHAIELLKEVLTYNFDHCEFENGKIGISYIIHYLIKNNFLNADYFDLYEKQHNEIIDSLNKLDYDAKNIYIDIDYLFFIHIFHKTITNNKKVEYNKKLTNNILYTLSEFDNTVKIANSRIFYKYAEKLLSTCISVGVSSECIQKYIKKITEIDYKFKDIDCVCEEPLFYIQLFKYRLMSREKNVTEVKIIIQEFLNSISLTALDFQEKINLCFNLYYIYNLDNSLDFRHSITFIVNTIIGDVDSVEKKIFRLIKNTNDEHNIIINKLLLLCIHWEQLSLGVCNKYLIALFRL